ncbi:MAG: WG repeat-containing protein [Saprospiraceae bacterium]|nr:WG repeat-containing protein [Saprospiraceae bacterium]
MNLNGKYSIIDENNENIISFDYDFIDMRNGKFISNKNGEFELFEITDGKILSLEKTKNARIITSDLNFLLAKNDLFETIKNESKVFLPYPIKAVKRVLWDKSFKETYLIQDAKGKWSVFYEDNRSKEEYDDVSIFNELQDNSMLPIRYINISKNGLWGLIDLKGNEVVKPIFEEIIRTDFDYLVVKNKNKYGIFNVKTKQYILSQPMIL